MEGEQEADRDQSGCKWWKESFSPFRFFTCVASAESYVVDSPITFSCSLHLVFSVEGEVRLSRIFGINFNFIPRFKRNLLH
jgi:hypothetical protein